MTRGFTIWLTGMSGAGKSTIGQLLERRLLGMGARVELLDGDVVRTEICRGLGFSREDRNENVRRIGFVCELLSRNGVIAIAAAISPYRLARDTVRMRITNFIEVHVECPLDVLVDRDVKGLYRKAIAGEIPNFTGVSDPYEPPVNPEIVLHTALEEPTESVDNILEMLTCRGLIEGLGLGGLGSFEAAVGEMQK